MKFVRRSLRVAWYVACMINVKMLTVLDPDNLKFWDNIGDVT
jgi:hypothetical protein